MVSFGTDASLVFFFFFFFLAALEDSDGALESFVAFAPPPSFSALRKVSPQSFSSDAMMASSASPAPTPPSRLLDSAALDDDAVLALGLGVPAASSSDCSSRSSTEIRAQAVSSSGAMKPNPSSTTRAITSR